MLQRDAIEDHAELQMQLQCLDHPILNRSDRLPPLLRFTARVLMNSDHWARVSLIRAMGART